MRRVLAQLKRRGKKLLDLIAEHLWAIMVATKLAMNDDPSLGLGQVDVRCSQDGLSVIAIINWHQQTKLGVQLVR